MSNRFRTGYYGNDSPETRIKMLEELVFALMEELRDRNPCACPHSFIQKWYERFYPDPGKETSV